MDEFFMMFIFELYCKLNPANSAENTKLGE